MISLRLSCFRLPPLVAVLAVTDRFGSTDGHNQASLEAFDPVKRQLLMHGIVMKPI